MSATPSRRRLMTGALALPFVAAPAALGRAAPEPADAALLSKVNRLRALAGSLDRLWALHDRLAVMAEALYPPPPAALAVRWDMPPELVLNFAMPPGPDADGVHRYGPTEVRQLRDGSYDRTWCRANFFDARWAPQLQARAAEVVAASDAWHTARASVDMACGLTAAVARLDAVTACQEALVWEVVDTPVSTLAGLCAKAAVVRIVVPDVDVDGALAALNADGVLPAGGVPVQAVGLGLMRDCLRLARLWRDGGAA